MSEFCTVAVIIGSLRAGSFSRKIARAAIARAAPGLSCRIIEIGDLPLYNEDLDTAPPAAWVRFREEIRHCAAVLFVTPEYNRSVPGCLKNALDVASRPSGQNAWDGMPAAVISVTPYKLGAFGANHALRQTFVFLNMPVMQQPEAYIGAAGDLFGSDGTLTNADTDTFLRSFMETFSTWITTVRSTATSHDFASFMTERDKAASAYVNGDPGPLDTMVTSKDPATFFHPKGPHLVGAGIVKDRYDRDAKAFSPGGTSRLEVLQSAASGDLAFWSGLQHAKATLGGKTASMILRITEVFRFEGDGWKLVHRHADTPPGD